MLNNELPVKVKRPSRHVQLNHRALGANTSAQQIGLQVERKQLAGCDTGLASHPHAYNSARRYFSLHTDLFMMH
jgi:hypothetical protein